MRYSIEPRNRIYVKAYGFLSFAKSMGNKYSPKLLDSAKESTADTIKTTSKRAIQKSAEATGDLIANKIADKITNVSKSPKKFIQIRMKQIYQKRDIYLQKKRQQIIDELRLV